jgi:hypothetical protein
MTHFLFDSHGITLLTLFAVLSGIFVHILKQLIAARRNGVKVTLKAYAMYHLAETVLCALCGVVFYLALPELSALAPELASKIGLEKNQTILSSFAAGYIGNSLADFLGGRVASLTGVKQE